MAQEVSEQKNPKPPPPASYANGTTVAPRVPAGKPVKRGSGGGMWIVFVILLIAAIAAAAYYYLVYLPQSQATATTANTGGKHGKGGGTDKIRVVTATATRGDISVYLVGLGSVNPLNTDTIQSRVNGQLMKVDFTEGQMVKVGDKLLEIDDRPYKALLEQYAAQKERDQALLENAKIDLQRYETLLQQNSIQSQTRDTQVATVKQDQATVDSDQALIDQTNLNITYCNITAPIGGRVGLRLVDVGNYVQSTSSSGLLVITQLQPISVIFTIPEDSVPVVQAKLNTKQQLTVEAFDRSATPTDMVSNKKKLATGTLLTSDNQIDPATGTLRLKAVFQNEDNALFPNQFVNTRLSVETKKSVVIIPVAAIQYGTQGPFVYVVDETDPQADSQNATVKMSSIVVGTIEGDKAEIQKGVEENDVVVIDGVDKLQNGSKVILSTGTGGKKQGDSAADAAAAAGS